MEELPSNIIEDLQDVYALIGKDSGLHISEVGKCLRMLNLNPSEQDVKNLLVNLDISDKDSVDFEEFIKLYKSCKEKCKINEEEVRNQLYKLDKNEDGRINSQDLKDLLMTGEEPLTLYEAEALVNDFDKGGKVVIQDFLDALLYKNN